MSPPRTQHFETLNPEPPRPLTVRVGSWLFKRRTWLPLPIVLAILLIPAGGMPASLVAAGALGVTAGELTRLWGVSHIGAISRTRSDRLGPLVSTGPFARVRNPLYLGNLLIWGGFALSANLLWLVPVIVMLVGLEYHAIVRWEEALLESRLGESYRDYMRRVPRWVPAFAKATAGRPAATETTARPTISLRATLFSERGTLIAIVAGYVLLFLKARGSP